MRKLVYEVLPYGDGKMENVRKDSPGSLRLSGRGYSHFWITKCSLKSHSRDENIKLHADTAVRICCLAQDVTFGTRHQMVTQNALWPQSKITPYIKEQDSAGLYSSRKKINLENKFPVHHYLVILMGASGSGVCCGRFAVSFSTFWQWF